MFKNNLIKHLIIRMKGNLNTQKIFLLCILECSFEWHHSEN